MWIYWILFLWPAIAALALDQAPSAIAKTNWLTWLFAILLTLVIGLRFEVGMDWDNYLVHLDMALDRTWLQVLQGAEPAYYGANWLAARIGTGIWLVNLISAVAFVSGLIAFSRRLPNPWLALTIAMPYMAIVMAMNYTRQGAAFGLVLWALLSLHDGRMWRFVALLTSP